MEVGPSIRRLRVQRCRQFAIDQLDYGVKEFDAGSGVLVIKLDRWMYRVYDFKEFLQVSFASVPDKKDVIYVPNVHRYVLAYSRVDVEGLEPSHI